VVGAYYYLRIVKLMYFDEPAEEFESPIGMEMRVIIALAGIFILFFAIYTSPFIDGAQAAATALLP
jgi:NADH-quinone oxidoreductase subunit N